MKLGWNIAIGLLAGLGTVPVRAQLQILPARVPQAVFAGGVREINMQCRNTGDKITTTKIRARIWQTTSATAVMCREVAWNQLQVLPRQTVLESVQLDFPPVTAETRFLVQWLAGTNDILGTTTVEVFPTNVLAELKPLLGDAVLGVFDPQNELKPALVSAAIKFADLEISGFENFTGRLVMIRTAERSRSREQELKMVKWLAKKNVAVIWVRLPLPEEKLVPSFYSLMAGTNAVVVVRPDMVAGLPENPQSQMNLVGLCRQALQPENISLANLNH